MSQTQSKPKYYYSPRFHHFNIYRRDPDGDTKIDDAATQEEAKRKVAIEAARIQRDETRRQAIEVYKQMCPSKNCKGCASRIHKQETQSTRCDGNCARIRLLINGLDRIETLCI